MSLTKEAKILRLFYFGAFAVGVTLVVLMHTFERPILDTFRVPTFINFASYFNGLPYLTTFKIYQITLITTLGSVLIDALCLTRFRSKRLLKVSEISTILGLVLLFMAIGYFSYNFLVAPDALRATSAIFIAFSTFLVVLDLLTFQADERVLSRGAK